MALIYSYIFPTIFLVAFWVLYRYETPPIVRHMGELLTVTILGGACFGLPTSMVSDRERGVWRRFRLTPVPTFNVVASTVFARYLLLLTAGLVQLGLAMLIGMPAPRHPFGLFVAFTCVSFAFLGLGLVIATMADNVPAVQALGQCIFLPMLIIGGVAVPLESLPDWAQHVAAFFPGPLRGRSVARHGDGGRARRGRVQHRRAAADRRGRLRGRRTVVPMGRAAALRDTSPAKGWVAVAIVGLGRGRRSRRKRSSGPLVSTSARATPPAAEPRSCDAGRVACRDAGRPARRTCHWSPRQPPRSERRRGPRPHRRHRGPAVPSTGTRGTSSSTDAPAAPATPAARPAPSAAAATCRRPPAAVRHHRGRRRGAAPPSRAG